MKGCCILVALAACNSVPSTLDLALHDLASGDLRITAMDRDGDGLSDAEEAALASHHLPYLSLMPIDGCPTSGLAVRVTPEPAGVRIRYAWLFDHACETAITDGGGGVISLLVDPAKNALVSMRAIARPDTSCQSISTCGICLGQSPCAVLADKPAVWASQDRHGLYVNRQLRCTQTGACSSVCSDAMKPTAPPIVNVGEPQAPLVRDLTADGFIQPQNGWTSVSLQHYDPWGGLPFGTGPSVAALLSGTDTATPVCGN